MHALEHRCTLQEHNLDVPNQDRRLDYQKTRLSAKGLSPDSAPKISARGSNAIIGTRRRVRFMVQPLTMLVHSGPEFQAGWPGAYANTPFFLDIYGGGTRAEEESKFIDGTVLIEALMNRSALFGGRLYRNDVEYPGEG
ncbi:hypothetical protein KM043_016682 [Ampulex compressa]|nr:hypothetical protein KM043_016682 [Ampulex compressa]